MQRRGMHTWEEKVALFLNSHAIMWTSGLYRFEYKDMQNNIRTYMPDFYLPDFNLFLEVKGFETDKDRCKWSQFPHTLLILKQSEIEDLDKWYREQLGSLAKGIATCS